MVKYCLPLGGGGIRLFNFEKIGETGPMSTYIIHGATVDDLKTFFMLKGAFTDGGQVYTLPFAFTELSGYEMLTCIVPDPPIEYFVSSGEYLDGVKVQTIVP